MSLFGKYIGIDLGTANVLVYVKGRGIVLNEPSVVAYAATDNRVVAVGTQARHMLGRTPGRISVVRPMRDGVIADYMITEAMLRYFIKRVSGKINLFRPVVMICIPAGVTNVESRAVLDATIQAGAKEAHLIAEPLAAAIGAGIPIHTPSGNMVIDIGGGTTGRSRPSRSRQSRTRGFRPISRPPSRPCLPRREARAPSTSASSRIVSATRVSYGRWARSSRPALRPRASSDRGPSTVRT
jgi:hypothetical protein